jgi:cytosine/adenosine deaminase-related metal-dependent hydrolase
MLAEVRQALLVARARGNPSALSARDALRAATRGSARCLGRDDIGSLEAGRRADVALFALDPLGLAGSEADPVAALAFCAPQRARHLFVEGRPVVRDGQLVNVDEREIAAEGRRVGRRILAQAPA